MTKHQEPGPGNMRVPPRNDLIDHGCEAGRISGYEYSKPLRVFVIDQWFEVGNWSDVKHIVYNHLLERGYDITIFGREGRSPDAKGFRWIRKLANQEFIDVGFDANTLVMHCCNALRFNKLDPLENLIIELRQYEEEPQLFPETEETASDQPLVEVTSEAARGPARTADRTSLGMIRDKIRQFTEERDWDQFHNPKDLAIAISIEASELLEHFLWKEPDMVPREKVAHEIADVLIYCIQLCDKLDIDITRAISRKMAENARRYPVEKAKGNATKYTDFK